MRKCIEVWCVEVARDDGQAMLKVFDEEREARQAETEARIAGRATCEVHCWEMTDV